MDYLKGGLSTSLFVYIYNFFSCFAFALHCYFSVRCANLVAWASTNIHTYIHIYIGTRVQRGWRSYLVEVLFSVFPCYSPFKTRHTLLWRNGICWLVCPVGHNRACIIGWCWCCHQNHQQLAGGNVRSKCYSMPHVVDGNLFCLLFLLLLLCIVFFFFCLFAFLKIMCVL